MMTLAQQVRSNVTRRTLNAPWWPELLTTDVEGARSYYGELLQWNFQALELPAGARYTVALRGGNEVAGLNDLPGGEGAPRWLTYFLVTDARVMETKAQELGATVLHTTTAIGDRMGLMTLLRDPQGAELALWEAGTREGAELVNVPGALTWNELRTHDGAASGEFYGQLFGWDIVKQDYGAMDYWTLEVDGRPVGGMYGLGDDAADAPVHWGTTFGVESTDRAIEWTKEQGGKVTFGPMDTQFGRVAGLIDPSGAAFGVMQPPPEGFTG
jgi:uncharacterized protein